MTQFPFPLWHGTSAYLLPAIREHGLGGRNLMAQWRVMDFLERAFPQVGVDENDFHDPDILDLMPIRAAINGGAAGMNFEYGSVYVAGGYDKAAAYAQTAPELISFVRILLEVAKRRGLTSVSDGLEDFPEVREFLKLEPKPVVLKLSPVLMAHVQNERGEKITVPQDAMHSLGKNQFWSQVGFRLTEVIPFERIEVIDASNHHRSIVL
jgi:hypothetical protein